jgi:hypothetical protein
MPELPSEIANIKLEITNEEIFGVGIGISERQTRYYSKSERECNSSDVILNSEVQCYRSIVWQALESNLNCSIVGFEVFSKNKTKLKPCRDFQNALESIKAFDEASSSVLKDAHLKKCLSSCYQTEYRPKVNYLYVNTMANFQSYKAMDPENFVLTVFHQTFLIEERLETLVYDFSSFVSAAGGNLGLFLGISLFSLLHMIASIINKRNA